jgi:phenylalanyl-tRNA synthetase beta subunit/tRNA-binding EMAP/Myf-like protein
MLYLRSWIEDYIDLSNYSDQELSDLISLQSGEVDEFYEVRDQFGGGVVIGRIENVRKHPNADRLKMFDINLGARGSVQIVSAAENVVEGLYCPVALEGCRLAYFTIQPRPMRGEKSEGMCLGKSELMLETEMSPGLWDLREDLSAELLEQSMGQSICRMLPDLFPSETVFDIKYLPDKIGVMGNHLGLAYELSTVVGSQYLTKKGAELLLAEKLWDTFYNHTKNLPQADYTIEIEDRDHYSEAFLLFDIQLPTLTEKQPGIPHDIQRRMFLLEKNQLGNVADLSNYLLADVGQPSHFFSKAALAQRGSHTHWIMYKTTAEKSFAGLGQLKDTVIPAGCDVLEIDREIAAIPAISGSEYAKTTEKDRQIIVEVANFPAEHVAQNSFDLKYRSEGARIWNSGVSPVAILVWCSRFLDLNQTYNMGWICSYVSSYLNPDTYSNSDHQLHHIGELLLDTQEQRTQIHPNTDYIQQRLDGTERVDIQQALQSISYKTDGTAITVHPAYSMIKTQEDLLFKVAELVGFGSLASRYFSFSTDQIKEGRFVQLERLRDIPLTYGFQEVVSRPFVTEYEAESTAQSSTFTAISSQRKDENVLASNRLSQLTRFAQKNIANGVKNIQLFELSPAYTTSDGFEESLLLELLTVDQHIYTHTSVLHQILNAGLGIGMGQSEVHTREQSFGRTTQYRYQGQVIAEITQLSQKFIKGYTIPVGKNLIYTSIHAENLTNLPTLESYPVYRDLSDYQPLTRAYSLRLERGANLHSIFTMMSSIPHADDITVDLKPIERFADQDLDILNVEVTFTSFERNLDSEEIGQWEVQLVQQLREQYSVASLR